MKRLSIFLLFLLIISTGVYSFQNETSTKLYSLLQENQISCEKQLLSQSYSEEFPFSILIQPENSGKYPLHKLAIIISQKDALAFSTELLDFIKFLQNIPPYQIDILLSANDYSPISDTENYKDPSGTYTYLENLDTTSYTSAIIISSTNNHSLNDISVITPAAKNIASPINLTKGIINSFKRTNTKFYIHSTQLFLYRLGIISSDKVLTYVLNQNIPAIHLTPSSTVFTAIEDFITNEIPIDNDNWDSQYAILNFLNHYLFIPETFLLFIIVLTMGVGLFLLSFSFLFGKMAIQRKIDLKKTIPLTFFIIIILLISLLLAQLFTNIIVNPYENSPIFSLVVKLGFTFLFYLLISRLRFFIHLPQTVYIYGFLLTISTFINIVVFSLCDLSLFFFFALQYIIAYISRTFNKKYLLIITFILFAAPFAYALILSYSDLLLVFNYFTFGTFVNNLLFSLGLMPYVLMMIRIFVLQDTYKNTDKTKIKELLKKLLIIFTTIISLFLFLLIGNKIYLHLNKNSNAIEKQIKIDKDENIINLSVNQNSIYEKQTISLQLSSEYPVIRYQISIYSPTLIPVYDANYPYDAMSEKNKAIFSLDDFPPEQVTITYTSNSKYESIVKVLSYVQKDNSIIKNEKEILISPQNSTSGL